MSMHSATPASESAIEDVAAGQKMIIWAIVLNIVSVIVSTGFADLWVVVALAAIALGITGLLRLAKGLGYSTPMKVVLVVLAAIPLVSLIMLLIVNGRATKALKEAGYRVGLFGARKR